MPKDDKNRSDKRLALLADRLAILLVIVKQRHGDNWDPWFGEGLWEDEDAMGELIREWPEYETAKKIVRLWIKKHDKRIDDEQSDLRNRRARQVAGDTKS